MFTKTSVVPALALSALLSSSSALAWISSAAGDRYTCGGTGPENYFTGATVCPSSTGGTALSGYTSAIVYTDDAVVDFSISVTCEYGTTECEYTGASGSYTLTPSSSNPSGCAKASVEKKRDVAETLYTSCPKLGKNGTAHLWSAIVESGPDGPTLECQYLGSSTENESFDCTYSTDGTALSSTGSTTYCPLTGCAALSSRKKRSMVESRSKRGNGSALKSTVGLSKKKRDSSKSKRRGTEAAAAAKREAEAEAQPVVEHMGTYWSQKKREEEAAALRKKDAIASVDADVFSWEKVEEAAVVTSTADYSHQWTESNRG